MTFARRLRPTSGRLNPTFVARKILSRFFLSFIHAPSTRSESPPSPPHQTA